MRCGFFTTFIVCHVNLVFVLHGVCAKDAIRDSDDSINNITNNVDASAATAAASPPPPPSIEILSDTNVNFNKLPTILIVTLFRNKAHTMPYFFTYLNRLDYPKQRIALW